MERERTAPPPDRGIRRRYVPRRPPVLWPFPPPHPARWVPAGSPAALPRRPAECPPGGGARVRASAPSRGRRWPLASPPPPRARGSRPCGTAATGPPLGGGWRGWVRGGGGGPPPVRRPPPRDNPPLLPAPHTLHQRRHVPPPARPCAPQLAPPARPGRVHAVWRGVAVSSSRLRGRRCRGGAATPAPPVRRQQIPQAVADWQGWQRRTAGVGCQNTGGYATRQGVRSCTQPDRVGACGAG